MIIIILIISVLPFALNSQKCDLQGSLIGDVPSLPFAFQVDVEINIVNENRSSNQKWTFDGPNRLAALEIKENNSIVNYIFNYETDEVFQIKAQINTPDPTLMEPPEGDFQLIKFNNKRALSNKKIIG
jgi:hypothetical protein